MILKNTLSIAVALATLSTAAFADEITVVGTNTGTFSNPPVRLSYTSSALAVTTVNGEASLDFGQFLLIAGPAETFSGTFSLAVTFTIPAGTLPNPGTFTANLTGSVDNAAGGGARIAFPIDTVSFTFPNGSFDVFVNSVNVQAGTGFATLTGGITNVVNPVASVPDGGATVALLGLAMCGMAIARQKLGLA